MPSVAIPESVLCPVLTFKNMIRATPALVHHPAFVRRTDKGRIKPLLYKHLQEKIKILMSKTGRDPQLYSSHSFRRGGCTWAFKAGVLLISFNTTGTGYLIVTKDTCPLILRRS